jgi:putative ABC transport system permease protein
MPLIHDLRLAARVLSRERGIAVAAVLTVALGVGANTAIFSIVNSVLLQPLPYAESHRLVTVNEVVGSVAKTYPTLPVNAWHYNWWRQNARSFDRIAAADLGSSTLTGLGEPEQLDSARTSSNFFDTLGASAALGRTFASAEDQEGSPRVAVISHALWQRKFSSDPSAVGRTVQLDHIPHTIIGVLPPAFRFPSLRPGEMGSASSRRVPDVIRPLVFSKDELAERMGRFNYICIARLAPGVTLPQAKAEMNAIAKQLETETKTPIGLEAAVTPLRDTLAYKTRRPLLLLLAAVGSVLLIACLNLASLFLARAERRSSEFAIRIALGASRSHLMKQIFTESLLLSLGGGALGILLAAATLNSLIAFAPPELPRITGIRLDGAVLLFAAALTLATGFLFAAASLLRIFRADPNRHIRSGGRNSLGAGVSAGRTRQILIAAEVGLSVVLLTVAGLLAASFSRVLRADQGFHAPTVLATDIQIAFDRYKEQKDRDRFHERLIANLESQPGIVSAAIVTALPLTGETWVDSVSFQGDPRPDIERPTTNVRFASPGYFRTLGLPLVAGRTFTAADQGRKVAVISESLAAKLWPGRSPLGRNLSRFDQLFEVIGVAKDVKADADKPAPFMMYRPDWDWSPTRVRLIARSQSDPHAIANSVRAAVRFTDPTVPVREFVTMRDLFDDSVSQRRLQTTLLSVFAAVALLLAAIGIYGVVAYSVTRRRGEMGLRISLGAQPRDLYSLLIGHTLRPVLAGLVLGVPAALAASRALSSLLYEVQPTNPSILAAVAAILLLTALAASFLPARRAASISPLSTLRSD